MNTKQSVIIYFNYGLEEDEPFYELSDKLRNLVDGSGLGEYDGHEMAKSNSDGSFYMYGPDAKKLYEVVKEAIEKTPFMKGANVVLRFGPPEEGVKEVSFVLNLN
ncbi:MAG TPA: hypothetical protein VHS53_19230 [Mucilaginibacter sp.]|nr:hypothetical protein [Mucilaginibacter sp.]